MKNIFKNRRGNLTLQVIIFGGLVIILASGFVLWSVTMLNLSLRNFHRALAFSVAEAGIEYYRWHLAHAPTDFEDGTGHPGPFTHDYYDRNGNLLGQFILDISPSTGSSTIITIQSTGHVAADPSIEKIILVKLGIPTLAQYEVASNDNLSFGTGTEVFGQIRSNGGIHFDGLAHNLVESAQATYADPDYNEPSVFGVYTRVNPKDPYPPTSTPNRPDVFISGRQFPVPALDFAGLTLNLASLQTQASSSGVYASSSGALGYNLIFNASGTYSLYQVTVLKNIAPKPHCSNDYNQSGWGSWSIQVKKFIKSGPIPANGIFFFNDNVWVSGNINNYRVTIGSGVFPDNAATRTSITVNDSLTYTNYNGSDAVALVAQKDINVGLVSDDTLRIDGALLAQNGRVGRFYYGDACNPNNGIRTKLTNYGMIVTNNRYVFNYPDGSGYQSQELIYDSNLLYNPPPGFPLTGNEYVQVFWQEVK
ncbi:MAG: hypothetical protein AAB432_02060 [Patescibacteria group bacterium]